MTRTHTDRDSNKFQICLAMALLATSSDFLVLQRVGAIVRDSYFVTRIQTDRDSYELQICLAMTLLTTSGDFLA